MAPKQDEPTKPFGVAEIDGRRQALSARAAWELVNSDKQKFKDLLFYWPWDEGALHPMRPRKIGERARSKETQFCMAYLPGYCPAHTSVGESLRHYKSTECLTRVRDSILELQGGLKSRVRLSGHLRECRVGNRRIDVVAVVEAEVPEVQALLRSSFVAFEICYSHECEPEKPQELADRYISILEVYMDYELAEDASLEEIRKFEARVIRDLSTTIRATLLPARDPTQKLAEEIVSLRDYLQNVRSRMEEQISERAADQDAERKVFNKLIEDKVRAIVDLQDRLRRHETASLPRLVVDRMRSRK